MRVAVFLPNWVGDVVMATPALRALRQHFASAHILGVMRPYVADVLAGSPWLNETLWLRSDGSWRERWPGVALTLRQQKVDVAVLFPNSFRSAWTAWLGGCRQRIGFVRYGRGALLTHRLHAAQQNGRWTPAPILLDYNRLAIAAGCPEPSRQMELFTTSADEAAADRVWSEFGWSHHRQVVALNPGAAYGAAKHWPNESFAALARRFADRGYGVLVLCGPSERAMAREIGRLAGSGVMDLSDYPLSLGLTKACVKRAALLVTTDSGPRHFAAAFGRPVVTLFGPTHIEWTETFYEHAVHLQKTVPCGPCQLRVCPLDHRCMTMLSPEDVWWESMKLLRRSAEGEVYREAS